MNDIITIGHARCRVDIWTLGAAVNGLWVPDRAGALGRVCPGYATADERLAARSYLGEIVGPVANRIAGAAFTLDGVTFATDRNEGENTLHSGPGGLHRLTWAVADQGEDHVRLAVDWPAGRGGFPGPLHLAVEYRVDGQTVTHVITATAEAPTLANICAHAYFNLSGSPDPMLDETLAVAAGRYLPVGPGLIPLPSAPAPVEGPLDLRRPRRLGDLVTDPHPQIAAAGGLDHAFVLDAPGLDQVAVELADPSSGRRLRLATDCPAVQVYSGHGLPVPYGAIAIEAEDYPGAPGRPDFPSIALRPGEEYRRETRWTFDVVD